MKIRQKEFPPYVVLNLEGKLKGGPDAETLRNVFEKLVAEGKKNIIVNLKKVKEVNSNEKIIINSVFV